MTSLVNRTQSRKPSPPPYPFHCDSIDWEVYLATLEEWERDRLADGFYLAAH